jgi:hypothetical protein
MRWALASYAGFSAFAAVLVYPTHGWASSLLLACIALIFGVASCRWNPELSV